MRNLLFAIAFLVTASPVTADDTLLDYCNWRGAMAQMVATKRINKVPENRVLVEIQQDIGRIPPQQAIDIRQIVTELYDDEVEFSHILNVYWVRGFYFKQCMEAPRR